MDGLSVLSQHRVRTEQALRQIRQDAMIDDGERIRRITELLAQANTVTLELVRRGTA